MRYFIGITAIFACIALLVLSKQSDPKTTLERLRGIGV